MDSHADDRTPLLGRDGGLPQPAGYATDHPVFLRACHSPWALLSQNILCYLRGLLLVYLVASAIMLWTYKAGEDNGQCSGWRHIFDFAIIAFGLLFFYMVIVSSWTFTHLYFPDIEESSTGWEYALLRFMSTPKAQDLRSLRKQYYFMLFYAATCVACFMNTFYYWMVTRPHNLEEGPEEPPSESSVPTIIPSSLPTTLSSVTVPIEVPTESPTITIPTIIPTSLPTLLPTEVAMQYPPHHYDRPFSDLFGEGWFPTFNIINLYVITTVIVLVEIFWLNSIKRPVSSGPILFGLVLLAFIYLGWAAIGEIVTGCFSFFWLSEEEAGSREAVVAYCIVFVVMAPIMYALFYGFTALRETSIDNRARAQAAAAAAEALREN